MSMKQKIDNPFEMLLDKMNGIEINIEEIKAQLNTINEQLSTKASLPKKNQAATRSDAAKYLGVSVRTIDALLKSEQLKPFRLGSSVRFTYEDLDAFIKKKKQN